MKRIFDLIISLILIIMLLPIMIIVSIGIKIDSPGPIFYCRKSNGVPAFRLGKDAKPFFYFKFRSMAVGTKEATRFGFFIRRWHLDELSELFLVLTGRMSLVGPRALERGCITHDHLSYYESLHNKPGVTGYMQINRKETLYIKDHIEANNLYFKNQSLMTDIIILIKTPACIWRQKCGAKTTMPLV